MIHSRYDQEAGCARIVLRPNRSWTWRANVCFVATLMAISLLVASGFTMQGFWVVLPFSVLEMAVLSGCLYCCVRRTHITEVLHLSRTELVYERGVSKPTRRVAFDRYFTRFFVRPSRHPWYGKRIELKCRDQALEVGQFLAEEEKDQLVSELRRIIRKLDSPVRPERPSVHSECQ